MKKLLVISLLAFVCFVVKAQNAPAAADTAFMKMTLKQKLAGKTWYFIGTEKFHTKAKPDSTQKNDMMLLNDDNTYTQIEDGKDSKGVWSVNEAGKTLILTDGATKATRALKVASIIKSQMALSFKDANLVTYYKFYYIKDK